MAQCKMRINGISISSTETPSGKGVCVKLQHEDTGQLFLGPHLQEADGH